MIPEIVQSTEDGVTTVTLEWRGSGNHSAILLFVAGDDDATFSWRDDTRGYAEAGIEFKLSEGMPQAARARLAALKPTPIT